MILKCKNYINIIDAQGFAKVQLVEEYFVIAQALHNSKLNAMVEHLRNRHFKKLQGHGGNGSTRINDHIYVLFLNYL